MSPIDISILNRADAVEVDMYPRYLSKSFHGVSFSGEWLTLISWRDCLLQRDLSAPLLLLLPDPTDASFLLSIFSSSLRKLQFPCLHPLPNQTSQPIPRWKDRNDTQAMGPSRSRPKVHLQAQPPCRAPSPPPSVSPVEMEMEMEICKATTAATQPTHHTTTCNRLGRNKHLRGTRPFIHSAPTRSTRPVTWTSACRSALSPSRPNPNTRLSTHFFDTLRRSISPSL
ncbi:hypothetical protein QBC39DRAFT_59131 [Podospora conica]|nr:hypothetical protein QBC39DRAFT_59131 [Schizothecium conicum]